MITPEEEIVIVDLSESLLQRHSADSNSRKNKLQELSSDAIEEFLAYQKNIPSEWWALLVGWELRQMWSLCGTYIVISIFNLMLSIVTQMFVGRHLGTMALAGASMATLEVQGFAFIVMLADQLLVMFMCSFESWYSLGIVLSSAYFANTTVSVASFAICINYLNLDLTFMLGMSTAAIIRVSTEIECANPRVARFSAMVVNATSILISIILSTIIIACGTTLGKAFIGDDEVIKAVSEFTPLLAISVFLNGVEPILSGVATGIGRPGLVVCFYACNYYLIGLTVGFALGFMTYLGVAGIWWGVILGFSLQTLVLVIVVATTDWDKEVDKAFDRLKQRADEEILA
ncbi:hypothetical protein IFM89_028097 [Coptis chinensis]|uniref:Uncharacterized protein n=1 Tax=Coptis chinensis TaxID=261450 RepID=A0A835HVZ1_9MAGN|nr:hypothetical protein IFM89_028097 [Coptis chinensis]